MLLLGTWPADWDVSQQPFLEALGCALAFEAFAQAVDIRGLTCVLRNDAAAAIASFRKGGTQLPSMQRCALRLDRAAALLNVDCLPLHVPGLSLEAEGIDWASLGGADFGQDVNVDSILGPSISDGLWLLVARAAVAAGWGCITVDAFASESHAWVPRRRFWSRFHEPNSEAIDALVVLDWTNSGCPSCCAVHREVVFTSSLVLATLEKECADRALCVLLVPVAVLAPHWGQLLVASVLLQTTPYVDGFLRIRDPARVLARPDPRGTAEMAVFAPRRPAAAVLLSWGSGPGPGGHVRSAAAPATRGTAIASWRPCWPSGTARFTPWRRIEALYCLSLRYDQWLAILGRPAGRPFPAPLRERAAPPPGGLPRRAARASPLRTPGPRAWARVCAPRARGATAGALRPGARPEPRLSLY